MAHVTHLSNVAVNACLDNALNALNGGVIRIYDGAQPANPDTAVSTQHLLSTMTLSATAFAAATSGSKTAAAIGSDTNAAMSGTAAWFRAVKSDGTTAVIDGSVGASSSFDMNISSTTITAGDTVSCSSWVVSMVQ